MKSIIYITILFLSINTLAQQVQPGRADSKLNPKQQAELRTKELALSLDLSKKQMAEIQSLELERAKSRQANRAARDNRRASGEQPTKEARFEMRSQQLDSQKAHQDKMKKILSEEQYNTWKEIRQKKMQKRKFNKKQGDENSPRQDKRGQKGNKASKWN